MNDKKPPQFATDVKWYPVRRLAFVSPTVIDKSVRADLLGDITQTNVARWTIEYGPSWRHFKITSYQTTNEEPRVQMVPESAVKSWEPML